STVFNRPPPASSAAFQTFLIVPNTFLAIRPSCEIASKAVFSMSSSWPEARRVEMQIGRASCRERGECSGGPGARARRRWGLPLLFFSSRRRHTRFSRDWSSDVCSSDLLDGVQQTATGVLSGLPDVLDRAEYVLSNPAQLRDRVQSRVQHVFELARSTPSRDALLEPLSQIRERLTEPRHQPATDRRQVHERLGQRLHTRPGAPSALRQVPEEPLNVVDSGRRREHAERVPHHAVELLGQPVHTDPQSLQKPTGRQLGDLLVQTSEQVLLNRPPNQLELGTKSAERLNRLLGIRRQPLQSLLKLLRSRSTQRLTN